PSAQLQLGSAYYSGQGVPQSYIKAGMWWAATFVSAVRVIFNDARHETSAWWAAQHRRGN
ncbi:MAG: SEL1-like repeat protein, partial [Xanthomonadaceae bacterium]|nr:SEL1-like repeat protein [Xanthomonadaceae bacterium]